MSPDTKHTILCKKNVLRIKFFNYYTLIIIKFVTLLNKRVKPSDFIVEMKNTTAPNELRQRIVKTAMQLYMQRGIKDVTMDELAHTLSISKRTLYEVFDDKEELLLTGIAAIESWTKQRLQEFIPKANNILEIILYDFELKLKEIDNVTPSFFIDLHRYPKVTERLKERRKEQRHAAIKALNEGQKQEIFRSDINLDLVYDMMTGFHVLMQQNAITINYPLSEILFNTVFTYLRGCATQKGMTIIDNFIKRHKA